MRCRPVAPDTEVRCFINNSLCRAFDATAIDRRSVLAAITRAALFFVSMGARFFSISGWHSGMDWSEEESLANILVVLVLFSTAPRFCGRDWPFHAGRRRPSVVHVCCPHMRRPCWLCFVLLFATKQFLAVSK